jgi:hypothetical protein
MSAESIDDGAEMDYGLEHERRDSSRPSVVLAPAVINLVRTPGSFQAVKGQNTNMRRDDDLVIDGMLLAYWRCRGV